MASTGIDGKDSVKDGKDPVKDGKESGKDGKESGKDGKESGKDGKESGKDGKDSVKDGKESGKDGKDPGKDGKDSVKDGKESGKDGKSSVKASFKKDSVKDCKDSRKDGKNSVEDDKDSVIDNQDSAGDDKYSGKDDQDSVKKAAILAVLNKRMTIRKSAIIHGLRKSTLADMVTKVKKRKKESDNDSDETAVTVRDEDIAGHGACAVIFTKQQEIDLKEYILKASKTTNSKLTRNLVKMLAYDFAKTLGNTLNHKMPMSWETNEAAGEDWLKGFRKRHPDLLLGHQLREAKQVDCIE